MKRILNNERPALFISMIAEGKSKSRETVRKYQILRERSFEVGKGLIAIFAQEHTLQ